MKMGPLFPKKEKKDVDQQIMEAGVRLRGLERRYRTLIEMEVRKIRADRKKKKDNPRAVSKLKNAYYSLSVVKTAQERLADISSTRELYSAMNEMSSVLKLMNQMYGKTEKVNSNALNRNIGKMNSSTAKDKGGMEKFFNASIDDLVDDNVVNSLVQGDATLDHCLEGDEGILQETEDILPMTEEFLKAGGDLGGMPDMDIQSTLADIEEMSRNL